MDDTLRIQPARTALGAGPAKPGANDSSRAHHWHCSPIVMPPRANRRTARRGNGRNGVAQRVQAPCFIQNRAIPVGQDPSDEYRGYWNPVGANADQVKYENLSPESMWSDYVSPRKPVVIDGLIDDDGWNGEKWRDINHLRSIAGTTQVKIEPIDPDMDQFGSSAKRSKVPLSQFLSSLSDRQSAGKWYMTTQYLESDDEEGKQKERKCKKATDLLDEEASDDDSSPRLPTPSLSASSSPNPSSNSSARSDNVAVLEEALPEVDLDFSLPPPTDALSPFFPLPTPKLMGGLVLQQCNLWLGNGATGKSSGLHHDFHDNLYLLLSGRKRFLIWPPSAHRWLEPHGQVRRVHPNGFIEYAIPGQPSLRADGLTEREALQWLIRARKRAALDADERAAKLSGEGRKRIALRKGKGRQTQEQAVSAERLRIAEAGLLLLDAEHCEDVSGLSESDVELSSDAEGFSEVEDSANGDTEDEELKEMLLREVMNRKAMHQTAFDDSSDDEVTIDGSVSDAFFDDGQHSPSIPSRKRTCMRDEEEQDSDESLGKSRRGEPEYLRIPRRGLPGGFRGSLNDLDGRIADSDEDYDDVDDAGDVEFIVEGEEDGLFTFEGEDVEAERSADGSILSEEQQDSSGEQQPRNLEDVILGEPEAEEEPRLEVASQSSDGIQPSGLIEEVGPADSEDEDEAELSGSEDAGEFPSIRGRGQATMFQRRSRKLSLSGARDGQDSGSEDTDSIDSTDSTDYDVSVGEEAIRQLEREANRELRRANAGNQAQDEPAPPSFSEIRPQVMHWAFGLNDDPTKLRPGNLPAGMGNPVLLPRQGCPPPMEIHLEAGQMLYLPTGWFHEVTSYVDPQRDVTAETNVHMALNYWFHAPTAIKRRNVRPSMHNGSSAIEVDLTSCKSPYQDEEIWNEIRQTVESRVNKIRSHAAAELLAAQQKASAEGKGTDATMYDEDALQRLVRMTQPKVDGDADSNATLPNPATMTKRKRDE